MCYIRGQASDYDRWAKLTGSEKFSYKNVLPYFKKSQKAHGYGDPEYNGTDGEINVEKNHMNKLLKLCFQPTSHADKKKLAERIQSLSEAKQWKNKATVADHNLLAGNYAIYYVFR